jgi:hypothetical protein
VKELIKVPKKRKFLEEAINHENRLALHSEPQISQTNYSDAHRDFTTWIKALLPEDKYQRFYQLLKNPVATLSVTGDIYTELSRIFDGQNAFYSYEFTTTELQNDFNDYLKTNIQDKEFFKTKGFDNMKCGINSVLVVDLPMEGADMRPEPFYYFVDVKDIIDTKVDNKGCLQYIIFSLTDDLIGAYDDTFYRVFNRKDGQLELVSESAHNLGYTPASFFWNKNMSKDNPYLKKAPITDVLVLLDRYLAGDTFKEHADLYSAYPIVVSMEKLCNFEGCQDGIIVKEERLWDDRIEEYYINHIPTKCESCANREMIGAGTNFEYPAKQSSDDPDLSNPVQIVSADIEPLEYLTKKLAELSNKIKSQVIGSSSRMIDDQAINEMQVMGSFESRRNVLISIKESFEHIHKFANDTVALLRYGDSFKGSVVYYGDEFYLKSLETLQMEYKSAKENGEPDEEIDAIYRQIIQSKYKGNKDKIERAWILLNLNPMPHNTLEEAKELFDTGVIAEEDFIIKVRFNNFISRFEREQTNVIYFAEAQEFNTRINLIYNQLKTYANESKQIQPNS